MKNATKMTPKKMKIHYRKDRGLYYVDYTVDGRRVREHFRSRAAAQSRALEIERDRHLVLAPEEARDAAAAIRALRSAGVGLPLSQVAAEWLKLADRVVVGKLIGDAVEEYIFHKERIGRRAMTLKDVSQKLRAFAGAFSGKATADLSARDIEEYCISGDWQPRTCRNVFGCVRAFLRWCYRRKWLAFEPDFDMTAFLPRELKKAVTVFSASEIENLFGLLQGNVFWRKYIPFYAVQAFAGLRNAEASRLLWEDIDFEARTIRLKAEIVKTGEDFTVRGLPGNLWAWLEAFRADKWSVPYANAAAEIRRAAGWKPNGLRHTFATMHVSLHRNPAETSLILRHRNQQRLWQNYLANPREQSEADRYFLIVPEASFGGGE